MKFQISNSISTETALNRAPKNYRTLLGPLLKEVSHVTLLQFKGRVVLSRDVASALSKLPKDDSLHVAIAACFTIESHNLLDASGIKTVTLSDFGWSDESYTSIRTDIGKRR